MDKCKKLRLFGKVSFPVLVCALIFLFMPVDVNSASDNSIRVFVDNEEIHFNETDGTPFLDVNGRSQVPLRKTMETAGAAVSFDNAARTVSLSKDGKVITLIIDYPMINVGESIFRLDTAPIIIQSRTFVPLRFIFEQFGYDVEWNGAERSVNITQIADGVLNWSEIGPYIGPHGYWSNIGFTALPTLSPETVERTEDDYREFLQNNEAAFVSFGAYRIDEPVRIIYEIHKINPNGADELMTKFVFSTFVGELPEHSAIRHPIPYSGWKISKGQYRITVTSIDPIVYYFDGETHSNALEEISRARIVENIITVI
jgi:hypothetical protein